MNPENVSRHPKDRTLCWGYDMILVLPDGQGLTTLSTTSNYKKMKMRNLASRGRVVIMISMTNSIEQCKTKHRFDYPIPERPDFHFTSILFLLPSALSTRRHESPSPKGRNSCVRERHAEDARKGVSPDKPLTKGKQRGRGDQRGRHRRRPWPCWHRRR